MRTQRRKSAAESEEYINRWYAISAERNNLGSGKAIMEASLGSGPLVGATKMAFARTVYLLFHPITTKTEDRSYAWTD